MRKGGCQITSLILFQKDKAAELICVEKGLGGMNATNYQRLVLSGEITGHFYILRVFYIC